MELSGGELASRAGGPSSSLSTGKKTTDEESNCCGLDVVFAPLLAVLKRGLLPEEHGFLFCKAISFSTPGFTIHPEILSTKLMGCDDLESS